MVILIYSYNTTQLSYIILDYKHHKILVTPLVEKKSEPQGPGSPTPHQRRGAVTFYRLYVYTCKKCKNTENMSA